MRAALRSTARLAREGLALLATDVKDVRLSVKVGRPAAPLPPCLPVALPAVPCVVGVR